MTIEQIKQMDKEHLLAKETIFEVLLEDSDIDRQYLLNEMQDKAKELRCAKALAGLLKAFKTEAENSSKANVQTSNIFYYEPLLKNYICGSWIVDEGGVKVLTVFGEKIVCYHPIIPVEILFNIETNTEKITLAYLKYRIWKLITVDKGLIASSTKIVKLADYGISVTSETAKLLVQYLNDIENMNEIPYKNSTSKFGWHKTDFIPYDRNVVFDDESRFKELTESLDERGSYDIWLELARKIRQNTKHYEPQLYMAASFASILLKPLNMLPFIVNLWGSTGKGKTVAMMLAASIWANPSENKYITDSYSTQNAFEIRLDILNHLPLMMDDLSKVRDKLNDNFTDLIYLLCSGKGKDRSNVDLGLNKVKTWQCTILSNMERPLATDTMKGGAINRILDFEMQEGYIFENGNAVVEILKDNYGFAGRKYVDLIKDLSPEALQNMRREFEAQIKEEAKRQNSEKEEKQILPLSVVLLADKIATDYIFEDGIYLDLPTMVSNLKDVNEVSEGQRAYDAIMDTVVRFKFKFVDSDLAESWGTIKDGYVNILSTKFNEIAKDNNFSPKAFCSWAKSKELLSAGTDKKPTKCVRVNGKVCKCYCIKLEELKETEEEKDTEFHEIKNESELPFD